MANIASIVDLATSRSPQSNANYLRERLTEDRRLRIHAHTLAHTVQIQKYHSHLPSWLYGSAASFGLAAVAAGSYPSARGGWKSVLLGFGVASTGVCACLSAAVYLLIAEGRQHWPFDAFSVENFIPTIRLFWFLGNAGEDKSCINWGSLLKLFYPEEQDQSVSEDGSIPGIYLSLWPNVFDIRILEIEAGTFDADINCRMRRAHIGSTGYTALSYVWGKDPPTKFMMVNGKRFPIRDTLHKAIYYMREENRTLRLWVDAICINQQDVREKNEQVKLMPEIYQQAESVVVFLGDGVNYSALFAFVNDINTGNSIDKELERADVPTVCNQFWQLLQKPWWSRVWIIQEFAYANMAPVVMYGHHRMDAISFTQAFEVLRDKLLEVLYASIRAQDGDFRMNDLHIPLWIGAGSVLEGLDLLRSVQQLLHWRDRLLPAQYNVSSLLMDTQNYQATDPRDKLFALHSLMMDPLKTCFLPDYRMSSRAANTRMAAYLLCVEKWCEMYSFFPTTTDGPLPSWVPDFSASQKSSTWSKIWDSSSALSVGPLECWVYKATLCIQGFDCGGVSWIANPNEDFKSPLVQSNDASQIPCSPSVKTETNILSQILGRSEPKNYFPTTEAELEAWDPNKPASRWMLLTDLVQASDSRKPHQDLPDFNNSNPSPELADAQATLIRGRKFMKEFSAFSKLLRKRITTDEHRGLTMSRSERLEKIEDFWGFGPTAEDIESELRKELSSKKDDITVALTKLSTDTIPGSSIWLHGLSQGSVLVTDTNFAGLCRQKAQMGDRLVILSGMPTPFLVRMREADSTYIFVGPVRVNDAVTESITKGVQDKKYSEMKMYFK